MSKPILCLDFDGTIHSYSSGWQGADVIPDPPTEGAIEFLWEAMDHFTVVIVSSRLNSAKRRDTAFGAIIDWLNRYGLIFAPVLVIDWPEEPDWPEGSLVLSVVRPPSVITIDDRALTFDGTWPDVATLKVFRPWNKRPEL